MLAVVAVIDSAHFQLESAGTIMVLVLAGDWNAIRIKESEREVIFAFHTISIILIPMFKLISDANLKSTK